MIRDISFSVECNVSRTQDHGSPAPVDVLNDRFHIRIVSQDLVEQLFLFDDVWGSRHQDRHVFPLVGGTDQYVSQTASHDPFVKDRDMQPADDPFDRIQDPVDVLIADLTFVDRNDDMTSFDVVSGDDIVMLVVGIVHLDLVAVMIRIIHADYLRNFPKGRKEGFHSLLFHLQLFRVLRALVSAAAAVPGSRTLLFHFHLFVVSQHEAPDIFLSFQKEEVFQYVESRSRRSGKQFKNKRFVHKTDDLSFGVCDFGKPAQ